MHKASITLLIISMVLFLTAARVGWKLGLFGLGVLILFSSLLTFVVIFLSVISIIKKIRVSHSALILSFAIFLIIFMNMFACWNYDNSFENNRVLNAIFSFISGYQQ